MVVGVKLTLGTSRAFTGFGFAAAAVTGAAADLALISRSGRYEGYRSDILILVL